MKTLVYNWIVQFCDPVRLIKGLRGLFWYWKDYFIYKKLPGAEPLRLRDTWPALHEKRTTHEIDAQYFYVNSWAVRRILAVNPPCHVDIASQVIFASLLSAVIPVMYVDYRPLQINIKGLNAVLGDLLSLKWEPESIISLSCLHVAEHVGLGRYGDPLDPYGTKTACSELQRVLATGGNLYFAVPIGKERVCFNAHRVHSAENICEYFRHLELVEYSGVHDDGRFVENVDLSEFRNSDYACGMFHFRKMGGTRS